MTLWNLTRGMVDAHAELFMGAEAGPPAGLPPTIAGPVSFPADADQPDPVRCGAGSTVAGDAVDVPQRPARRPAGSASVPPIAADPATIGHPRLWASEIARGL